MEVMEGKVVSMWMKPMISVPATFNIEKGSGHRCDSTISSMCLQPQNDTILDGMLLKEDIRHCRQPYTVQEGLSTFKEGQKSPDKAGDHRPPE